jgi:hypothetical protein
MHKGNPGPPGASGPSGDIGPPGEIGNIYYSILGNDS